GTVLTEQLDSSDAISPGSRPLVRAFELEANIDEVVWRPWPGVFEGQLVVALTDVLHARIERSFKVSRDQERRVHNHAIADRLVRSRRDRDVAQRPEDFTDI